MLIIANWKMHGDDAFVRRWAEEFVPAAGVQTAVCPPFPFLSAMRAALSPLVAVGGQDVSQHRESGPHTGEVSATMLAAAGASYCIVGHSERRLGGETDAVCAAKLRAAAAAGLSPIFCVGETADERAAGKTAERLRRQLDGIWANMDASRAKFIVAYEPVWAIGGGGTPTPDEISAAHSAIRERCIAENDAIGDTIRVVYGGSVRAENARRLLAAEGVDGLLAGGASLDAAEFSAICRLAGERKK